MNFTGRCLAGVSHFDCFIPFPPVGLSLVQPVETKQKLAEPESDFVALFAGDDDSTHLCSQLWCSVLQTLTTFLQLGHQQTLTLATPILVKTWNVVAGEKFVRFEATAVFEMWQNEVLRRQHAKR